MPPAYSSTEVSSFWLRKHLREPQYLVWVSFRKLQNIDRPLSYFLSKQTNFGTSLMYFLSGLTRIVYNQICPSKNHTWTSSQIISSIVKPCFPIHQNQKIVLKIKKGDKTATLFIKIHYTEEFNHPTCGTVHRNARTEILSSVKFHWDTFTEV